MWPPLTGWSLLLFASLWWLASAPPNHHHHLSLPRWEYWHNSNTKHECEISRVHRWRAFCHHSLLVIHTHTHTRKHTRACASMSMHTHRFRRNDPTPSLNLVKRPPHIVRAKCCMRHKCGLSVWPLMCESKCSVWLVRHSYAWLHSRVHEDKATTNMNSSAHWSSERPGAVERPEESDRICKNLPVVDLAHVFIKSASEKQTKKTFISR